MLATAEAKEAISRLMPDFGGETVAYTAATGRVLRQAVVAERDQPPFDRVTMDGVAVRFDALARGTRSFHITATQHAGDAVTTLADDAHCIEVMTGAMLPLGSDCVVPVERITVADGVATIEPAYHAERHQFVHARGSDHRRGTEVLAPGTLLSPTEIAIVASCGLSTIDVSGQPAIRVISTGNELVAPGAAIEPQQIRLSNGPALIAMLQQQGFTDCSHEHLPDEPGLLRAGIDRKLQEARVLILSGGVSMGQADFVPEVLAGLGVRQVFHKVSQRPGKPMWFGIGPDNQVVFGLPGNPVSTLVCCRQYVLPALFEGSGRPARQEEWALLAEEVVFKPELTFFMPVRLQNNVDGRLEARPAPTNTSGDFTALGGTDGYVELAREQSRFSQGSPVRLHRWATP